MFQGIEVEYYGAPTPLNQLASLQFPEARTVIGSYLGSAVPSRDIPVYADLWRAGKLPVEELISDTIGLDDLNSAFDALSDGRVVRQIIDFDA